MKVLLVDDHPLFAEGLRYLLQTNGIDVIGTASGALEALEKARSCKPDLVLMDVVMPTYSGLDALQLIKAEMPDVKVVMLSTSDLDEDLFQALKFGASGYLLKSTDTKTLLTTLLEVERGQMALAPNLANRMLAEFRRLKGDFEFPREPNGVGDELLTKRHVDILRLISGGATYKEVGEALGITERTVKYHMARIVELLQLENKAQVIAYAGKMGILGNRKM